MAINYSKCPRCGSLDIIEILYGYLTHETLLEDQEDKIKLGR